MRGEAGDPVRPQQRHTRQHPCLVCGGADQDPRGKGRRCHGFTSNDGVWVHCSREDMAGALSPDANNLYTHRIGGSCRCGTEHTHTGPRHNAIRPAAVARREVAHYDYTDANGNLLFQVVRYVPKNFKQRRPDGKGEWIWDLDGVQRVLYRLPELLERPDEVALVPEGEKDVDRLLLAGFLATTNPMGAGKWRDEYAEDLRGKRVVILPDNDERGHSHAQAVDRSLRGAAATVAVLELPGMEPGWDVSEWLDAGHAPEELRDLVTTVLRDAPAVGTTHAGLRFYTPAELASMIPSKPDFIVGPGLAATGAITEIDGKVKAAGKTTLILHLVRSILDGAQFLGQPTRKCRVIYVTEQSRQTFMDALRRAGLDRRGDELLIVFREDIGAIPWAEVVAGTKLDGYAVVIFDTLGKLARIKQENEAGEWAGAMSPLQDLSASGRAVIVARHDRKSGGNPGDSARGSSQASGDVDIILAVRRPEGNHPPNRRVIESLSRYAETPEKIVIELTDDGYVLLGTDEAVAVGDARTFLAAALELEFRQNGTGLDMTALVALGDDWVPPLKRTTIQSAVEAMVLSREVVKTGRGRKGDPFVYSPAHPAGLAVLPELGSNSGRTNTGAAPTPARDGREVLPAAETDIVDDEPRTLRDDRGIGSSTGGAAPVHGTPLTPPRLCPACNQMHSVGTTCLSSSGVVPASSWTHSPTCRACGTTEWVTRDDGTTYCETCHPATVAGLDGEQSTLGWLS